MNTIKVALKKHFWDHYTISKILSMTTGVPIILFVDATTVPNALSLLICIID